MVKPFQMQVMAPEFSSVSLASQSMASYLTSQLLRLQTSAARSRSKPVKLPLSPTKP